jgi:hypothetical protein
MRGRASGTAQCDHASAGVPHPSSSLFGFSFCELGGEANERRAKGRPHPSPLRGRAGFALHLAGRLVGA